ncbi:MAG: hypothetical protein LBH74_02030 [Nitrososphaerota archaeon]|jgi:hypothetical protein|nr:hypothetical protein [Candidatus Termiticorpusculum sp.]MDR0492406.1 hypothetical protein [Nitrososphaerota archaeon]
MLLPELLILLSVIPFFLFLSVVIPPIQVGFILLWIVCLGFDIYSTYQFYLENPSRFQENERNKIFSYLTKKLNFKKAALLFPLTTEIPLLLFFALLPLQTLHTYMFPNTPNSFLACLAASFGIAAIGHLQAATKNTLHNNHHHKLKASHC